MAPARELCLQLLIKGVARFVTFRMLRINIEQILNILFNMFYLHLCTVVRIKLSVACFTGTYGIHLGNLPARLHEDDPGTPP